MADRVYEALPDEALRVELEHNGDSRRLMRVAGPKRHPLAVAIVAELAEFLPPAPAENRPGSG